MNDVSTRLTSVIVSVFTSMFTVSTLYTISDQKELWVAIFIVLKLFVIVLQRIVSRCCYSRAEAKDIDKMTIYRFTMILDTTITFVIVKLVMDIFTFLMAITPMAWYDTVNIANYVLFFTMVIFARLEF